jgi:hypothetical protein
MPFPTNLTILLFQGNAVQNGTLFKQYVQRIDKKGLSNQGGVIAFGGKSASFLTQFSSKWSPFYRIPTEKEHIGGLKARGVVLLLGLKVSLFWHNLVQNGALLKEGKIPFHRSSLRIWHLLPNFLGYRILPICPKSCFCLAKTTTISLITQLSSRKYR